MDIAEDHTHSFIIKIWLEESVEETGRAIWRGRITHVPSGKRQYIQHLDEIGAFIAPYVEAMGVRLPDRRPILRARPCWLNLRRLVNRLLGVERAQEDS